MTVFSHGVATCQAHKARSDCAEIDSVIDRYIKREAEIDRVILLMMN